MREWSPPQLSEFAAAVIDAESESQAAEVAVQQAAAALDAEVAVILAGGEVIAAVGLGNGHDAATDLTAIEPGVDASLPIPGLGMCTAMAAALEHQPAATLVIATPRPEPLTPQETALLHDMAAVTSAALRIRRSLAEEQAARRHLERLAGDHAALRRVATLVAEGAPAEEIYAAVAQELARRQEADVVALLRFETDGTATVVGGWGAAGIEIPLGDRLRVAGEGVAVAVSRTQRPAYVHHLEGPPGSVAAWLRALGIQSGIGTPIVVENELWGVAVAASRRPEALAAGSESRTAEFTDLVATAIANAEARADLRHVAAEQAALRRVATLVAQAGRPDAVFSMVADEVGQLIATADVAFVGRYEDEDAVAFVGGWSRYRPPSFVGERTTLGGDNVATKVHQSGRPARVERFPDTPATAYARQWARSAVGAPITVGGRLWGVMVVGSADSDSLPEGLEHELAQFTNLLATAIANADAQAELTASRARLIASADESRRRIVRDLHDATQQRLVHTIITLKLAQRAQRTGDDETAAALVDEALQHAEHANAELRELAHGILPSILGRGGLAAGVAELATRMRLPVDVEVTDARFPAAVEATAYFVIAEALTNVAKHSRAQAAHVRAEVVDSTLMLTVQDDGIGGARADGSGLSGLADRVVALGGRLQIDSQQGGGTRVTAALPVSGGP